MIHIGIDPGINGAVAVVADEYANVWDTPTRGGELDLDEMRGILRRARLSGYHGESTSDMLRAMQTHVTLEGGRIMPNRIKNKTTGAWEPVQQSAKTQAAYWRGIGVWEGLLAGLELAFDVVPPATWKRAMNVPGGGREAKAACVAEARRRFPSAAHLLYRARDDGRAEALLLADYGRIQAEKPRQGVLA